MKIEFLEPVRTERFGLGWTRLVSVGGVRYYVGMRPGRRVRLRVGYKYAGWGYQWHARVVERDAPGRVLMDLGPYGKSNISVKRLMEWAFEQALYDTIKRGWNSFQNREIRNICTFI